MVEEQATVVDREGDFVWVQTQRQSSCGHCSVKNGCGTQLLSKVLGNKTTHIRCVNKDNLKIGDRVIVGIEESALMSGSFLIYFLPLLTMILTGGLGTFLAKNYWPGAVDLWSILTSISGLFLGLVITKLMIRQNKKNTPYEPVILKKLSSYDTSVKPIFLKQ